MQADRMSHTSYPKKSRFFLRDVDRAPTRLFRCVTSHEFFRKECAEWIKTRSTNNAMIKLLKAMGIEPETIAAHNNEFDVL